ncbi:hypothetical protein CL654_03335 [bacterium]|nr:hypothetical protein [bacterium]
MVEKYLYKTFIVCLLACASLVISFIWNSGPPSDVWAQAAGTIFIIGFGSFLLWVSILLRQFIAK